VRGCKQYRYHPRWRQSRDETKFDRLQAFAAALPAIRARTAAHIARPDLSRERVLGNTRTVCRKSYIHPAIFDAYESGLMNGAKRPAGKGTRTGGLRQDEVMTLALLRRCEKQGSQAKAA
jgi:DNA topoisomerase IB